MPKQYVFSEAWDSFLMYILLIIPSGFIYAFVHELGHGLMGWALDFPPKNVVIPIFSDFSWGYAWIVLDYSSHNPSDLELILIGISGSLFSFIVGILFLLIAYFKHLSKTTETIFFLYGVILSCDFALYNLLDVFFMQGGDWYYVFRYLNPYVNGVALIIAIFYMYIWVRYRENIIKEINLLDNDE